MNQLIGCYRSPVGQRFVDAQPQLIRESGRAAARWGMAIAGETLTEMAKQRKHPPTPAA